MNDSYENDLLKLQIDLVTSQIWARDTGRKLLVVFEGRDAAGKDGTISRIVAPLSIRSTRVVALPKPSDREQGQWWFQRYVAHLPAAGEWVFLNRSWYNRSGVERVMGFSSPEAQEEFLRDVPAFERMLVEAETTVVKYWLDISKTEQAERLEERRTDPVKRLKVSPLDSVAQEKWPEYSDARNQTLGRTHTDHAPWLCVRADKKKTARLNVMRHLLGAIGCPDVTADLAAPDPTVLFPFEPAALTDGRLAV